MEILRRKRQDLIGSLDGDGKNGVRSEDKERNGG